MALLDQLFGNQQQGDGGMVQNILQQRFQPTQDDALQAGAQGAMQRGYVSPYAVQMQRLQAPMAVAGQLSNMDLQGQQAQALQLQNQMTRFQQPFLQGQMADLYGQTGNQPPVGFPQGQPQAQPQQNGSMPPVGFPANQNQAAAPDPRLKKAELAAMMGNKPLSEAIMAEYNADPAVVAQKAEAGKTGENAAANTLQANKSDELTKRLEMNLNAMLQLNQNVPSSGFVPAKAKIYMSQGMGANDMGDKGAGAAAANQWDQINNQQIISEIQQFIASGGGNTRTNQTLERIVKAASGIDKEALPASREKQIMNALAEIHNKNVSAGNLAGGKQPYQQIPVNDGEQQQPQSGRISIITPDGKPGTIDAAHLQDLLDAGGKQVQ